jgi:hypothetical protein
MALPPKETIKPKTKNILTTTVKEAYKHYTVWALFYLFIVEIISYFLWDNVNYKDFFYPLLNQTAFVILLTNIFFWSKRLNFCKFKKFAIISLILYYLYGVFAMIFKFESFIENVHYVLLVLSFSLFLRSYTKSINIK